MLNVQLRKRKEPKIGRRIDIVHGNWNQKYLKLTIPIREIVAGDACIRSCVSKMKFTLSPKRMRQPDGNVNNLKFMKITRKSSNSFHCNPTIRISSKC